MKRRWLLGAIPGSLLLGLVAVVSARPSPAEPLPKAARGPTMRTNNDPGSRKILVEKAQVNVRPAAPPIAKSRLAPPPQDVQALREWLLGLPDEELKKLIGTPALDGYVARITGDLMERRPDGVSPPDAIGPFLRALNGRIERLAAK